MNRQRGAARFTAEQGLAFTVLLGCLVDMSSDDAQWGWKARQVEATLR